MGGRENSVIFVAIPSLASFYLRVPDQCDHLTFKKAHPQIKIRPRTDNLHCAKSEAVKKKKKTSLLQSLFTLGEHA